MSKLQVEATIFIRSVHNKSTSGNGHRETLNYPKLNLIQADESIQY